MSTSPMNSLLTRLFFAQLCAFSLGLTHAFAQAVNPLDDPMPPQRIQVPSSVVTGTQVQGSGTIIPIPSDDVIMMNPFEVTAKSRGYYADTTMAGTRINSNIRDLGAAITVITAQQMDDFGMTDINDIFNFEVSTEGAMTFTDVTVDENGHVSDGNMTNPNTANRMRGIGPPTINIGGFESSGRTPLDRMMVDTVEIARGPNSSIAGLGNPAGTVNMGAASANALKNSTKVTLRIDGNNSFRQTLDVNRILIRNKLAVRAQQIFDHKGFQRKPSGTDAETYSFMVKYQPFKNTIFNATYMRYRNMGTRANQVTPSDGITPWVQRGEYTWDPLEPNTGSANATTPWGAAYDRNGNKINGTPDSNYLNSTANNRGLAMMWQTGGQGQSLMFIDRDGSIQWMAPRGSSINDAFLNDQTGYKYAMAARTSNYDPNLMTPVKTYIEGVSDRRLYDWSRINIGATDWFHSETVTIRANMVQTLIDKPKQYLAVELGWFREDSSDFSKLLMGKSKKNQTSSYLAIDVNRRLFDGTENPNYLRPYLAVNQDVVVDNPLLIDTYRAQSVYKLDFRRDKGWSKWLGGHSLVGYAEYKHFEEHEDTYRHAMISNHPWLQAGVPRGTSGVGNVSNPELSWNAIAPYQARSWAFYYVGDTVGQNIDYAPGRLTPGEYRYIWGNVATGEIYRDPAILGLAGDIGRSGGANNDLRISKGAGFVLQSHLLKDGLVVTVGARRDTVFQKDGVPPQMMPDGITLDHAWNNRWVNDWRKNSGTTRSEGFVLKPEAWIKPDSPRWLRPLRHISIFYNQSGNINLNVDAAFGLDGKLKPNPTGTGKDYGVMLQFFDGRLNMRFNRYQNYTLNQRGSLAQTVVSRTLSLDILETAYEDDDVDIGEISVTRMFGLNRVATGWVRQAALMAGEAITPEEEFLRVAEIMQMTPERLLFLQKERPRIREVDEGLARGYEFELNWSPTEYLNLRLNASQTEARNYNIAPGLVAHFEERLEFWQNLKDPNTGLRWWNTPPDPERTQTPEAWYNGSILPDWQLALAQEGLPNPNISKYSAAFRAHMRMMGITNHPILKGVDFGVTVRWQSKVGIGNYGMDLLDDGVDKHTHYDVNRVIWSSPITTVNFVVGYQTKLFNGKVPARFQFFIDDAFEDGGLRIVRADSNGVPYAFRIVDSRRFSVQATFDF